MCEVIINKPKKGDLTSKGFSKHIKIHPDQTAESLMNYGFTNYNKPKLHYSCMVADDISFNLTVDKKTLKVVSIDILDEDFLQPYDYQAILMDYKDHEFAKQVYYKVNDVLIKLQDDGVIIGFEVGMYV